MKTHILNIRLKFNKPVNRNMALHYGREHIHGICRIDNQETGVIATKMTVGGIKLRSRTADDIENYKLDNTTAICASGYNKLFFDNNRFILRYKGSFLIMGKAEMGRIAEMLADPYKDVGGDDQ